MLEEVKGALASIPVPVRILIGGLLVVGVYVAIRSRQGDPAASPVQDQLSGLGGSSPVPNPSYYGQQTSGQMGGNGSPGDMAAYFDAQLNAQARANELSQSAAAAAQALELSGLRAKSDLARQDADFQFDLSKRVSEAIADDMRRRGLIAADVASYDRQALQRDSMLAQIGNFDFLFGTGDTSATNNRPNISQQLATVTQGGGTRTVVKPAVSVFGKVIIPAKTVEEPIPAVSDRAVSVFGRTISQQPAAAGFDNVPGAGSSRFDILLAAAQRQFNQGLSQQVATNNAELEYQKKLIDLSKPKQKKFLGIIGGDVGSFLNSAAEIAAPVLTGGALRYNSYAPGSPVSYNPVSRPAGSGSQAGYPGGTPPFNPNGATDYLNNALRGIGPARQAAPQLPSARPNAPALPSYQAPVYATPSYTYA